MELRPEEITKIIRSQIKNYENKMEVSETGVVILVGDGIAKVSGLDKCMAGELVEFPDGSYGMAQNLEEDTVSIVILGSDAGIKEGEGLLTFGTAKAAGRIRDLLPYVKEAQIGIKLPDTVKIEIVESSVAYSIAAQDGTWWLISAEGKVLEQIDPEKANNTTKIEGITLAVPVGAQAKAYEEVGQNAFGDDVTVSVSGKDKLESLKQILQNLEMNGVMGTVTTVDVTQPTDLRMWFGEKYQILLGDGERIAYKIECMQAVFEQEQFLEPGSIDVSFTDEEHPKDVIFVPFVD